MAISIAYVAAADGRVRWNAGDQPVPGRAEQLLDALISLGRLRGLFDPLVEALPHLDTLVLLVGTWRLSQGAVTVTELVSVA